MTREEAKSCIGTIEMLRILAYNIHGVMDVIDANNCKKIIKALEQEPTTKNNLGIDLISRADALDCVNWGYCFSDIYKKINELPSVTPQLSSELDKNSKKLEKDFGESDCISREQAIRLLTTKRAQPSTDYQMSEVYTMAIKALEQEPTTKNDLGVECVSRQFMYDLGATCIATRNENGELIALGAIEELPSVTPIRPKGHWIDKQHSFETCSAECSSCHERSNGYVFDNGFSLECEYYDYCPKCGADMREVEE